MGDGSGMRRSSSINQALDKHWSALSMFDRALLLNDLGINGGNENYLAGKTIDQLIQYDQDNLPGEVRGRLIMAVTDDGFSVKEYERVRDISRRERM